ncbi:hypothetical protein [Spirosoma validum]|uniref:Uncharacterized protein n=1 Tax=Spirosoma validum TaxID=2771355 RepID=A0A927AYH9_9BACT|nr:hypothetical protein [Spirosoma validum]MBD2752022.1 hypothetical protein [Spirosoma validum]
MNPIQKSIQKYPELAGCQNQKEYADRVFALHPELPQDATPQQQGERNEALIELMLDSPFQTEERKQEIRNQTWEVNHRQLTSAIHRLISEKNRMPTINKLSQETGISRLTIRKHLRDFHLSDVYQEQLQGLRMLSTQVVIQLFKLAMSGDVKAARLYLDAVGGLSDPQSSPAPKQTSNYIQINNNVKIDQITFGMLPQTVQQEITKLVLQGLQTTSLPPEHLENS